MLRSTLQAILPKQKLNQVTLGLLLALFAAALLVTLVPIGQRAFVDTFNRLVLITYLGVAAYNAAAYGLTISSRAEARQVWRVLGVGLGLYALGEMAWLFDTLNGFGAAPPSLGGALVAAAYPLLIIALVNRQRLLGVWPARGLLTGILLTGAAAAALVSAFVLAPILRAMPPGREFEAALIIYDLAMDLALLVLANLLGASMPRARLSLPWNLMGVGFLFMTISDVVFIHAAWNGLYGAGAGVNASSRGISLGYDLAFLMLALGVFIYREMIQVRPEQFEFAFTRTVLPDSPTLRILPYNPEVQKLFEYMYFMVDPDRQVFFFSDNFRKLCQMTGGPLPQWGKPLHRVMCVDELEIEQLFADVQNNKIVARPADLIMGPYLIPVVIQAHTIRNSTDIYLSYRLDATDVTPQERTPADALLLQDMIASVRGLEFASSEMQESTAFFIIQVQELYTFLVRMNGFRVGQILAEHFNQLADARGADVCIRDGQVHLHRVIPSEAMYELLRLTLQTVRNLTTPEATQGMVTQLNEKIPEGMLRAAQRSGLAG